MNQVIQGKTEVDEAIEEQRNITTHFKYTLKLMFNSHGDTVTLEKKVETVYENGRRATPKFGTLRYYYMGLKNPTTQQHLFEAVVPVPHREGRVQMMFFNNDENRRLVECIKKFPAAFWWHYLLSLGLKKSCVQSHMDGFTIGARAMVTTSTYDPATWVISSPAGVHTFVDEMEDLLTDSDEELDVSGEVEIGADARSSLMETMRDRENTAFNTGDAASRRSGFEHSVGASTARTHTSARNAVLATVNNEQSAQLNTLGLESAAKDKKLAEKDKVLEAMALRMQQLEDMMTRNASLFSSHGSPVAQDPPLAGMEQNCTETKNDENVAMGQNG